MIQPSVSEEALKALAEFKAYAAGTLLVLDLIGTFVFALSGGVAGVKERLDLFGVLVLSFAAASAGGIMRDLLIGAVPAGGYQRLALPRSLSPRRVGNFLLVSP